MRKYYPLFISLILGIVCPILLFNSGKKPQDTADNTINIVNRTETENDLCVPKESVPVMVTILDSEGNIFTEDIDTYLVSVVLREMPSDFHIEALKAQAVVARTYTLRRKSAGIKHPGADICTDSGCCQGYWDIDDFLRAGGDVLAVDKVKSAVKDTSGMVLSYRGELIDATYFSCSGGMTEDAAAVWGADIPYLQATSSPGEENATHFTDTVWMSADEFEEKMGRKLNGTPSQWFGSVSYTTGGGVDRMDIAGTSYSGVALRQLLGLRSTAFKITAVGDLITITTKGFGHRVGMSQYGADAMATQGSFFDEILLHYYHNVDLVSLDNLR